MMLVWWDQRNSLCNGLDEENLKPQQSVLCGLGLAGEPDFFLIVDK